MTFEEWLEHGQLEGWISDPHCQTHDGTRMTEEEDEQFNDGDDPCIIVVRIW